MKSYCMDCGMYDEDFGCACDDDELTPVERAKINRAIKSVNEGRYISSEELLQKLTNNELNNKDSTHESNDNGSHNVEKTKWNEKI